MNVSSIVFLAIAIAIVWRPLRKLRLGKWFTLRRWGHILLLVSLCLMVFQCCTLPQTSDIPIVQAENPASFPYPGPQDITDLWLLFGMYLLLQYILNLLLLLGAYFLAQELFYRAGLIKQTDKIFFTIKNILQ